MSRLPSSLHSRAGYSTFIPKTHAAQPPSLIAANNWPVTASKSRACREGHTSGPCRWLFSVARPVGDVKSLKALHRYNVVKAPALGVITVWKWPAAFLRRDVLGAQFFDEIGGLLERDVAIVVARIFPREILPVFESCYGGNDGEN